tara:strand:+ start:159 stop:1055 length:897 start_codon:yes stop_codon:yes gene_type:complete
MRELEMLMKEYERIEEEAARRKKDLREKEKREEKELREKKEKEERIKEEKELREKIEREYERKREEAARQKREKKASLEMSPVRVKYEPLRTPLRDVTKKALSTSVRNRRRRLMEPLLPMKQPSFDDLTSPCVSQINSVSVSMENEDTLNEVCSPIEDVSRLTDVLETQLRVAEAAALKSPILRPKPRRRKKHFHVKLVQTDNAISLKRRVSMLKTVQKSRAQKRDSLATKTLRKISAAKIASLRKIELDEDVSSHLSSSLDPMYHDIPSPPKMMAPVRGGPSNSDRTKQQRRVSFNI